MPDYKWSNPHEWFDDYLARHKDDTTELFNICVALSRVLDSDEIQDLFERDMDADGYFPPEEQEAEEQES